MEKLKDNEELEKLLKENSIGCLFDAAHEQKLRRSLLNSRFYSHSFVERSLVRLGLRSAVTFHLVSVSLLSGVFLAFIFHFAVLGVSNFSTQNISKISRLYEHPQEVLQELYKNGKIHYSRMENDGTRVYVVTMDDDSLVEIHDKSPYAIILTSGN